jgi:hypothetical protein
MARPARPPLRLDRLEDRAVPAAFAASLGNAIPGAGKVVATDPVGNAVLAATLARDTAGPAVVVAKIDPDGNPLWSKSLAADVPWTQVRGVASDSTGNVYVVGVFHGAGDFDPGPGTATLTAPRRTWGEEVHVQIETVNSFVVKLDSAGKFQWAKALGAGGVVEASGLAADSGGNVAIVGEFQGQADFDPGARTHLLESTGEPDAFVVRLGADGGLVWAQAFAGLGFSTAQDVAISPDGTAFVGGTFSGDMQFDVGVNGTANGDVGAYVARVSPAGRVNWAKTLDGPDSVDLAAVAADESGGVYAAGTVTGIEERGASGPGLFEVAENAAAAFVTRLSPTGAVQWAKTFGGPADGAIAVADATADRGGVYVTGDFRGVADFDPGAQSFRLTADRTDLFLSRLNADGRFVGAAAHGGPGVDRGEAVARATDEVFAAGSFTGTVTFETPDGPRTLTAGESPDAFLARLAIPSSYANQPPAVAVDGTFAIAEGDDLELTLTATDRENDRLSVAWDVNGDGNFTDAVGPAATLSWDRLRRLGIADSGPARPMAVRVSDGNNPAVETAVSLLVENAAPRAAFRAGPPVREGAVGFVSFAGQMDPATADRGAGFRYSYDFDGDGTWDLGDGKTFAGGVPAAGTLVPARFLADSGPHPVRARVFDKDGAFTEYTAAVQVTNVAPRGRLRADGPVMEGRPGLVRFADVADPSSADRRAGFRYSYDVNADGVYEIGDGTTYVGSVPAAQYRVPAAFLADGRRTVLVRARVFDRDGDFTEATIPLEVHNAPPTARLRILGRAVVGKPMTIAFGGQSDASPADRAAGFTYGFDLDNNGTYERSGPGPTAVDTFTRPGTIRGKITDKDGGSSVYTLTILADPLDALTV